MMHIDELRQICQRDKLKTNSGPTLWHRKTSIYYTRICVGCQVTANQATWGSIIFGILGSLLFVFGNLWINLIAVLLLYVSLALDQIDGELARYYGTVNINGVYLDEIRHLAIYSIAIYCLSYPFDQNNSILPYNLLGYIGSFVFLLNRVEERLPLLIYADKYILNNNYSQGSTKTSKSDLVLMDDKFITAPKRTILSKTYKSVCWLFSILADQVLILLWILVCTILDAIAVIYFADNNHFFQKLFVVLISGTGLLISCRTIYSHWKDRWVEAECVKIDMRNKQ